MSEKETGMTRTLLRYALVLTVISLICTAGVAGAYQLTFGAIRNKEAAEARKARGRVLSAAEYEPLPDAPEVLKATDAQGNVAGYIAGGEGMGYGGPVQVVVGLDAAARTITGIAVVAHHETPGIGDRVSQPQKTRTIYGRLRGSNAPEEETSVFLKQFVGASTEKLQLSSDPNAGIQAVSGATRSSNAVVQGCLQAVDKIQSALHPSSDNGAGEEASRE